ncbi:TonB-dependent receptor [Asaia bogorensis NBRC 16594]|uniref:TonB-dependent receptor n=2 Tax=Asaia bogorensis TaxID=91915 RepID=A0AAN4U3S6_9PROT|nr:TonB-dependent receptor [Asaia bogorensis NBRC 16594]GBQ78429.1 TonB-dependent receptor [Asaia bogorensis NBRC 16594]GEL53950.1 TonB-dependent receptor [Asaia bogorensis NBRC 16594]
MPHLPHLFARQTCALHHENNCFEPVDMRPALIRNTYRTTYHDWTTPLPPRLLNMPPVLRRIGLLSEVSGVGLCVMLAGSSAHAAVKPDPHGAAPNHARSGKAEQITVKATEPEKRDAERGGGLIHPQHGIKAVSTVDSTFIARQAPISSAYQLVSVLPGANVASSDAMGLSPQTTISVRGLNTDSIGYVLEGMPLNDLAFYSGYPSQFADSENYRQIALAQGEADLDSPVLNAAGGLMSLDFRDPAHKAGGTMSASYGSYNTNREFIRLDTGMIGHTGLRGFVSYSHTSAENWRGPGHDMRHHIDFKLVRDIGERSHAGLVGSFNSTITSYYPQVSKDQFREYGVSSGNALASRYDPQNQEAGPYYQRLWRAPERTLYMGSPISLALTNHLTLKATPYAQGAYGNVPGGSTLPLSGLYTGTQALTDTLTLPSSADGSAIVRANYTQRSYRSGFTSELAWKQGWNELYAGYWFDYGDDHEIQSFSPVSENGASANIWGSGTGNFVRLSNGRIYLAGDTHTISMANALYVGDRMHFLSDRLLVDAGFKEVMVSRVGTNAVPGPQYRVASNSAVPLPRLGLRFQITPQHQIFLNATTNFRAPAFTALYNVYDTSSGDISTTGTHNLRNEYSISEEIGYRYTGPLVTGSLTFFNYNFTNRQIQTQVLVNNTPIQSTMNAGGQTSRGVDIELGLKPWHHFAPYLSGEYLHATIDNDIASGGDLLPTSGKTAVRSPKLQASAGLTYDDGHVFGFAAVQYTGRQYATFMNDERINDHTTGNLTVGYRFSDLSRLKAPSLRLNFINITNEHYLSGIADPTLNARDTTGRYGSTIAGSSPDYYIGGGFSALATATAGF